MLYQRTDVKNLHLIEEEEEKDRNMTTYNSVQTDGVKISKFFFMKNFYFEEVFT